MIDPRLYEEFCDIGRDIFLSGLVSSHGGNISVRIGDQIVIKRRNAQLGRLQPADLICTSLHQEDSQTVFGSSELVVHRQIYLQTSALAVVHAHPRTAIVLSLSREAIVPIDHEGSFLLGKVPVVGAECPAGSLELGQAVAEALNQHRVVMQRGHGSFATGQSLVEAYHWTSALEQACDILLEAKIIGEPLLEYHTHNLD